MADVRYPMSQKRYDELRKELEYMQTVREKEVAEAIKEARSFGDLSENSEYDAAREEQGKLHARINEYTVMLANAVIIERTSFDGRAGIGCTITIRDLEFNEDETYELVGEAEADARKGKMSITSPLGAALLDHRVDDEIEVEAPVGMIRYKIINIF